MSRERRMDTKQRGDREGSEILTSQGKANGFSVQLSEGRNITLLKCGAFLGVNRPPFRTKSAGLSE